MTISVNRVDHAESSGGFGLVNFLDFRGQIDVKRSKKVNIQKLVYRHKMLSFFVSEGGFSTPRNLLKKSKKIFVHA